MKKRKKLKKQLEILTLQREILSVALDIESLQQGIRPDEPRPVGFVTDCVGHEAPGEEDYEFDDESRGRKRSGKSLPRRKTQSG